MKKVGIIGIRGLPANYGAFDQFVDQFVEYTNSNKEEIEFFISAEKKNNTKKIKIKNVNQRQGFAYSFKLFFVYFIFLS